MSLDKFNIDSKKFGQRQALLRQVGGNKKITQIEIAEYMEVTKGYVSGVESGALSPSINYLIGIKRFFDSIGIIRPYDFYIEGSEIRINRKSEDELELLRNSIKDKDELIKMYRDKIAQLESQVKAV